MVKNMINNDWDIILKDVFNSEYFKNLIKKVKTKYKETTCYPEYKDIFASLKLTPYKNVKVVILGQDPYHGENEAMGLSFSVNDGIKKPPSLKNIYKELYNDLGYEEVQSGNLTSWAKEGVLLLNSILTVEKDKPSSHKNLGWENITDEIIKKLNQKDTPIVFILWGNFAKSKKDLITNKKHLILESPHPSPFSARKGFFNSKPFSKTNNFLKQNNIKEINWNLHKKN